MTELEALIEESIEAGIAGDSEKYISLMSDVTVEMIEAMGGLSSLFEATKVAIDIMGEDMFREVTKLGVDQFKVVDGKLEHVSARTILESRLVKTMTDDAKHKINVIRNLDKDEIDELKEHIKKDFNDE